MKPFKIFLSLILFAVSLCGVANAAAQIVEPSVLPLPPDWYPESLAVGPDGSFYVGSWRQGAVARLRPGSSTPEILVSPGSNGLANAQGVLVDAKARLIWVCSGTMGFTTVPMTPSALKSYDLQTGAPVGSYTMPDKGYCNDLAEDDDGAIYVTDSLHPRVLRLDRAAANLRIWKEDSSLSTGDAVFFLNGIAIDDARHVYVSAVMAAPYIWRIEIGATAEAGPVVQIKAPRILKNVDAVRVLNHDHLILFESNAFGHDGPYGGTVTIAGIEGDHIASLKPVVKGLNDPSSGVVDKGRLYFIESKYGLLLPHKDDDAAIPRNVPFDIQSVDLSP